MELSTLASIREAVRQYTRTPSEAQLTNAQLDDFINLFLLYDLPSEVRLFSLRTTLNFYTQPGVDEYATLLPNGQVRNTEDPLYNFKNRYITIHPQVFMAGVPASFTQYRDTFYGQWPQTNAVVNTGLLGNGTTGPFTGVVNSANNTVTPGIPNQPQILQKSLLFTALDTTGQAMQLVDYPQGNLTGFLGIPNEVDIISNFYGTINYLTGVFSFNFPNNTLITSSTLPNPIWVEYVPYVAGKPIAMLFFNEKFTIRPVPDRSYLIQLEADMRPTEFLGLNPFGEEPDIAQWLEFIALGTSIKILTRRVDLETVALLQPEFRKQMNYVNRTSLVQTANSRAQTIYSVNLRNTWGWMGSNWPY